MRSCCSWWKDRPSRSGSHKVPFRSAKRYRSRGRFRKLSRRHTKKVSFHRDLKPANIKLTVDGTVKVLDFGLAKLVETDVASQSVTSLALTNSPTLTSPAMTMAGVILGTAAYMSPEQAKGRTADKRSDIWAFGCILYEMLTGRQTFPNGETVSDTLAGILAREPDWRALIAGTPPSIRKLLEHCLRKDVRRRLRDIGDARIEIEEACSEHAAPAVAPTTPFPSRRREYALAALLILFLVTTVALALTVRALLTHAPYAPAAVRFEISPPNGATFAGWPPSVTERTHDRVRGGLGQQATGLGALARLFGRSTTSRYPRAHSWCWHLLVGG
jgi:eukaryotic-like serine/threonine-protein kinase